MRISAFIAKSQRAARRRAASIGEGGRL